MLKLYDKGVYLMDGTEMIEDSPENAVRLQGVDRAAARHGSIAWRILEAHNQSNAVDDLKIKFDALTSHDITYVGVIQTAKACGMDRFPIPYVLTNCHNSLCAVGGTINEDDHLFGLSAAERYGGIYVPQHLAVIHAYMREMFAGCGKVILGSDSHTRYGALGTLAIGEGGGELVKQLLGQTYDIPRPPIVGIYLKGRPTPGVGPQDVALTLVRAVFENGYVKNCIVEFVGEGVSNLSMDYRCGIDVMTTETTCLSSIWRTDAQTEAYLAIHDRPNAYVPLEPEPVAYYDRMIVLDLSKVRPMIALPFHPSNAYEIQVLNDNLFDILHEEDRRIQDQFGNVGKQLCLSHKIQAGKLRVDQGIIAGCSGGTFENLMRVTEILAEKTVGNGAFFFGHISAKSAGDAGAVAQWRNGPTDAVWSDYSHGFLRSLLWRWRCACKWWAVRAPYDAQFSQPGRVQTDGRSTIRRCTDGCAQHRSDGAQWRHFDACNGFGYSRARPDLCL